MRKLLTFIVYIVRVVAQILVAIVLAFVAFVLSLFYIVLAIVKLLLPILLRGACLAFAVYALVELAYAADAAYTAYAIAAGDLVVLLIIGALVVVGAVFAGALGAMKLKLWGVMFVLGVLAWTARLLIDHLDARALALVPIALLVAFNPLLKGEKQNGK